MCHDKPKAKNIKRNIYKSQRTLLAPICLGRFFYLPVIQVMIFKSNSQFIKVGNNNPKKSSSEDRVIEIQHNIVTNRTKCNTLQDNKKSQLFSQCLIVQWRLVYPLHQHIHGIIIPILVAAKLGIRIITDVIVMVMIIATQIHNVVVMFQCYIIRCTSVTLPIPLQG